MTGLSTEEILVVTLIGAAIIGSVATGVWLVIRTLTRTADALFSVSRALATTQKNSATN
jgi:hypothetical protein